MFLSDLLLLFIYQLLRESVGEYVNNQLLCLDLVFLCQIIDFLTRNDLLRPNTDILTKIIFRVIAKRSKSHLFRIVQVILSLFRSYLY